MPTRNLYFPGSRHAHYSEVSGDPLDTSMGLAYQGDNRIDNRHGHGTKCRTRHRFNPRRHSTSASAERLTPTTAVAGTDRSNRSDVGQLERATPRHERERRTSPHRRQNRIQASTSGLPRTVTAPAPPNGVNQSSAPARATAETVLSQNHPDLSISLDEFLQLPSAERHRLRALLPPPIPLVPKEKPSKMSLLERLNPFRRIRSLSMLASYRAANENSGLARRRSLARRG
ncbi:hypothetical protein V8E55_000272 [Tylopilus felleus]